MYKSWKIKERIKNKIKRTCNTLHSEKLLFTFQYLTIPLFHATILLYKYMGVNVDANVWFYLIFLCSDIGQFSLHNQTYII